MDFKSYFQYKAPNKNLPLELKQVEDITTQVVRSGKDESIFTQHQMPYTTTGAQAVSFTPFSDEFSITN